MADYPKAILEAKYADVMAQAKERLVKRGELYTFLLSHELTDADVVEYWGKPLPASAKRRIDVVMLILERDHPMRLLQDALDSLYSRILHAKA